MDTEHTKKMDRFLREPAVLEIVGLGSTQLHEKVENGEFPAPIPLSDSGRAVGWLQSEIIEWIEARKVARDRKIAERAARAHRARKG